MSSAIEFAKSSPKYKARQINWYAIWKRYDAWENNQANKECRLYLERLVNKQLKDNQ